MPARKLRICARILKKSSQERVRVTQLFPKHLSEKPASCSGSLESRTQHGGHKRDTASNAQSRLSKCVAVESVLIASFHNVGLVHRSGSWQTNRLLYPRINTRYDYCTGLIIIKKKKEEQICFSHELQTTKTHSAHHWVEEFGLRFLKAYRAMPATFPGYETSNCYSCESNKKKL